MQETSFSAKPSSLKFAAPFKSLFARDPKIVAAISESIKAEGFRLAEPVVCWDGIVVDGHTRVEAAKLAGCSNVYGVNVNFPDELTALQYAIARQRNRRNLTEAELLRCIQEVDKRKKSGERTDLAPGGARSESGKSVEETAAAVGVSARKVERARTVIDHAPEEVRQAVESGDLSINAAYKATQEARRESEPQKPAPPVDWYSHYYDHLLAGAVSKPRENWHDIANAMRAVASELDGRVRQ